MNKALKLCAGIDISKADFHVRLLERDLLTGQIKQRGKHKFDNTPSGHEALCGWLTKNNAQQLPMSVVMEASGVYHEQVAYALKNANFRVCIVLANKIKHFALSLNEPSKTDEIDAYIIARFGLERKLAPWKPFSKSSRRFKQLNRERQSIKHESTMVKNRFHAAKFAKDTSPATLRRFADRIEYLAQQVEEIEAEMAQLVEQDEVLAASVSRLCTIPGVGQITACSLLAETDGFKLFKSRGQVIKYSGYDIVSHQSGSSVNGKSHISKKGNSHVRGALHLPSWSARRKGVFKKVYDRQLERSGSKSSALVAVQRKLLIIAYTLIKKGEDFDPNYHAQIQKLEPALAA